MKPASMDWRSTGTASAARRSNCWPIPRSAGPRLRGIWPELSAIDPAIAVHLEIDAKYDVYLKRQTADVDAFRRDEGLVLTDIDYSLVPGLSNEARAKLEAARPRTVGQAGRHRRHDAGGAGNPGGLSAAGSAEEAGGRVCVELFHVKQARAEFDVVAEERLASLEGWARSDLILRGSPKSARTSG